MVVATSEQVCLFLTSRSFNSILRPRCHRAGGREQGGHSISHSSKRQGDVHAAASSTVQTIVGNHASSDDTSFSALFVFGQMGSVIPDSRTVDIAPEGAENNGHVPGRAAYTYRSRHSGHSQFAEQRKGTPNVRCFPFGRCTGDLRNACISTPSEHPPRIFIAPGTRRRHRFSRNWD